MLPFFSELSLNWRPSAPDLSLYHGNSVSRLFEFQWLLFLHLYANESLVAHTDLFVSLVQSRFNSLNDVLLMPTTKCITTLVFSPASFSFISQFQGTLNFQFHFPLCTYCLPILYKSNLRMSIGYQQPLVLVRIYHKPSKMFMFKPMFWAYRYCKNRTLCLDSCRLSSAMTYTHLFTAVFSLKWHLPDIVTSSLPLKTKTEMPENESLNTCANQTCTVHLWLNVHA